MLVLELCCFRDRMVRLDQRPTPVTEWALQLSQTAISWAQMGDNTSFRSICEASTAQFGLSNPLSLLQEAKPGGWAVCIQLRHPMLSWLIQQKCRLPGQAAFHRNARTQHWASCGRNSYPCVRAASHLETRKTPGDPISHLCLPFPYPWQLEDAARCRPYYWSLSSFLKRWHQTPQSLLGPTRVAGKVNGNQWFSLPPWCTGLMGVKRFVNLCPVSCMA